MKRVGWSGDSVREVLTVAALITVCASVAAQAPTMRPGRSEAPASPDPVVEFEKIVRRCNAGVEEANTPAVSVYQKDGKWIRRIRAVEVRYDVRKTNSLVTPILGQISVIQIAATGIEVDEQRAKALSFTIESSPRRVRTRYGLAYVWRDGKWSFKAGDSVVDFLQKDGSYGNALKEEVDASKGPAYYDTIGACFP